MKRKKKTKLKIAASEKILYFFTVLLLISSPLMIVFTKATLSKVNYDVERIKTDISVQKKKNQSISMAISELASLEKIQEVVTSQGLRYNNTNIKSID